MNKTILLIFLAAAFFIHLSSALGQEKHPTSNPRFVNHGLAAPFANDRGIVTTVDGQGRKVVLLWLFDRRGGYALLMIDAATGKSRQFSMPFDIGGDCPYASLFSSQGKFYTLFNGNFVEFDPKKAVFTYQNKTAPRMAMGMTEDDQGRIWAVTYPNSGLVCYDPQTKELTDYGYVYKENWAQYQRYIATDNEGWVYFGIGNTSSQIIAFNPQTREAKPLLHDADRKRGTAYVYRDIDGRVYGQALKGAKETWFRLYRGKIKEIGSVHQAKPKHIVTGSQALRALQFPDGSKVKKVDLVNRRLSVEGPSGQDVRTVNIDYTTAGTWVMGIAASPDKRAIIGGSSFPMRLLRYAIADDSWDHRAAYGQYNALTMGDQYAFFGSYPGGKLIAWDTEKAFSSSKGAGSNNNPRLLATCSPVIHRPHRVMVYPDNKTVIMAGTPDYGYTGGGLLFYDMDTNEHVLLSDSNIVTDQSTMSLCVLHDGTILGGTTTTPGTGGEKKANLAELYIINKETHKVEWKQALMPGVQSYSDLITRADGKVYGIADSRIFFVFDPATRSIVYKKDLSKTLGRTVGGQCPRIWIKGVGNDIYMLLTNGIVQVDHASYGLDLLDRTPEPVTVGGDYLKGRIYYISGASLFSYAL